MITFDGPKKLISKDQLMLVKLSMDNPHVIDFYLNSFKNYKRNAYQNLLPELYRKNSEFLGFLLDTFGIGLQIEDNRYVGVHKMYQNWDWAHLTFDESAKVPWILMFQGCDDSSYYLRFETEEKLDSYWANTNWFHRSSEMSFYN